MSTIIESIREQIAQKEAEIAELKNDLRVLLKYQPRLQGLEGGPPVKKAARAAPRPNPGTHAHTILQLFYDDKPLRGMDMYDRFKEKSGRSDFPYNQFSAQLSQMVKKGQIHKHTLENVSMRDKYWYAPPYMVDEKGLIQKYEDKMEI